jgi:hypothetical protein
MFGGPYDGHIADYERQQLNLIRRHQGLSPIPPPRPYEDFVTGIFALSWMFGVSIVVTIAVGFALGLNDETQSGLWQVLVTLAAFPVTFLVMAASRAERQEAAYQRLLERWRDAGCP